MEAGINPIIQLGGYFKYRNRRTLEELLYLVLRVLVVRKEIMSEATLTNLSVDL